MDKKSMTAFICTFARAYHNKVNKIRVFNDEIAEKIITLQEYDTAAKSMTYGIDFFNKNFKGNKKETLRYIMDNSISPTPLGRAAFAEKALERAIKTGTNQYCIFAAGYDTFAYRQPKWFGKTEIFEIDYPAMIEEKLIRLKKAEIELPQNSTYISLDLVKNKKFKLEELNKKFSCEKITFCSAMGFCCYLNEYEFKNFLRNIYDNTPFGSTIVFDFFGKEKTDSTEKQKKLAEGAKEVMKGFYSYGQIEKILEECGFYIYEYVEPEEITKQYFLNYNKSHKKHKMQAAENVYFCLAVKR